jgi:hypothetical protein
MKRRGFFKKLAALPLVALGLREAEAEDCGYVRLPLPSDWTCTDGGGTWGNESITVHMRFVEDAESFKKSQKQIIADVRSMIDAK